MSFSDMPSLAMLSMRVVDRIPVTLYLLLWMVTSDRSSSFCSDTFHYSNGLFACLSSFCSCQQ
ncbi:hypothetical protein BDV28DRAFT_29281 [Aspergillus coremiiformis]|uniref:Uncharacterized protein n=1 Tax=Aspergillus coremiiformis TaxID=138285 RepID=A0A5N6YZU7_9EURO|nr:hypothetical protein BDV28DRAFT_29281 [Aspergillus coremiiformis]